MSTFFIAFQKLSDTKKALRISLSLRMLSYNKTLFNLLFCISKCQFIYCINNIARTITKQYTFIYMPTSNTAAALPSCHRIIVAS